MEYSASRERALRVLLVEHEPTDVELCTAALRSAPRVLSAELIGWIAQVGDR